MSAHDPFVLGGSSGPTDVADLVDIDFEAWPHMEQLIARLSNPRYREDMDSIGVTLRVAAGLIRFSKPELVEKTRGLDLDALEETLGCLVNAADALKAFGEVAAAANARLMIAASVLACEGGEG